MSAGEFPLANKTKLYPLVGFTGPTNKKGDKCGENWHLCLVRYLF